MGNAQATPNAPARGNNFLKDAREPLLSFVDQLEEDDHLAPIDESDGGWAVSSSRTATDDMENQETSPYFQSGRKYTIYRGVLPNSLLTGRADVSDDGADDAGSTEVAIKRMRLGQERGGRDAYWNEVRTLANLNHPNVVRLLGYCAEEGEAMLIYEFVPGGNLQQALFSMDELTRVLTFEERLQIALDVARGLLCLHEQGIAHRDLRPANILLDHKLRAKITGLGFAQVIVGSKTTFTGEHQQLVGRVGYICPSYLETGQVSLKTDLFSLAVILLQLLAGRLAAPSEDACEMRSLVDVVERPTLGVVPSTTQDAKNAGGAEMLARVAESLAERARLAKLQEEFAAERRQMGLAEVVVDSAGELAPAEKDAKVTTPAKAGRYVRLNSSRERKSGTSGAGSYGTVSPRGRSSEEWERKTSIDSLAVSTFESFMDPRLMGDYGEKVAKKVALLALRCAQDVTSERPTTSEVVAELQRLVDEPYAKKY